MNPGATRSIASVSHSSIATIRHRPARLISLTLPSSRRAVQGRQPGPCPSLCRIVWQLA